MSWLKFKGIRGKGLGVKGAAWPSAVGSGSGVQGLGFGMDDVMLRRFAVGTRDMLGCKLTCRQPKQLTGLRSSGGGSQFWHTSSAAGYSGMLSMPGQMLQLVTVPLSLLTAAHDRQIHSTVRASPDSIDLQQACTHNYQVGGDVGCGLATPGTRVGEERTDAVRNS